MSKLWGSRFEKGTSRLADEFSFSIGYDYRLALYDVIGSMAHAKMLGETKIIPQKDAKLLVQGLKKIGKQIEKGSFKFDPKAEDIHSLIQDELKKIIGPAADKLHTARSRNDLIVLDMRLYCIVELNHIIDGISSLQKSIVDCALNFKDLIIPAYTHLQSAQVVLLSHYLLAYVEMLERDKERLMQTVLRLDTNPLGSCALSGTSLPTDREYVTKELGFISTMRNSIDAVSDRDFILESVSNLSILATHLSRMSEDFIVWVTQEFNFVNIDWSLCTGSSIMPHKKNPDILELIRGETAGFFGNLMTLFNLLKGLPMTYNRDLQLDKPPLFASVEKMEKILPLLTSMFKTLKFNKDALKKQTHHEWFFSVDIMEYLIEKGVSYREAHDTVGSIFKDCVDQGRTIAAMSVTELKKYHPLFELDVKNLLNPETSVKIKQSFGSTNPNLVKKQLTMWSRKLNKGKTG